MKSRIVLAGAICLFLATTGCQNAQNRNRMVLNPFRNSLASNSKQCIPPPPTGSIGQNAYYQQPTTARAQSPASLQAVPQLGQPQTNPAEPRSASLPSDSDWESGQQPSVDLGVGVDRSRRQTEERSQVAQASLNRELPLTRQNASVKLSSNLAWIPPFAKGILPGSSLIGTHTSADVREREDVRLANLEPLPYNAPVDRIPRTVSPPALLNRRSTSYNPNSAVAMRPDSMRPRFRVPSHVSQADIDRAPLQSKSASTTDYQHGATCNCTQSSPVGDLIPTPDDSFVDSRFASVDADAWR